MILGLERTVGDMSGDGLNALEFNGKIKTSFSLLSLFVGQCLQVHSSCSHHFAYCSLVLYTIVSCFLYLHHTSMMCMALTLHTALVTYEMSMSI